MYRVTNGFFFHSVFIGIATKWLKFAMIFLFLVFIYFSCGCSLLFKYLKSIMLDNFILILVLVVSEGMNCVFKTICKVVRVLLFSCWYYLLWSGRLFLNDIKIESCWLCLSWVKNEIITGHMDVENDLIKEHIAKIKVKKGSINIPNKKKVVIHLMFGIKLLF